MLLATSYLKSKSWEIDEREKKKELDVQAGTRHVTFRFSPKMDRNGV